MSWDPVYKLVKQIPRGRVITYGALAKALQLRGGARTAGRALAATPSGSGIPWHRVVGDRGKLLIPEPHSSLQRKLLESEGGKIVEFRVDFSKHGWAPKGGGKTSTVEVMEGLRVPDSGRISVCGIDPQRNPTELKNEIGATLQSTSLPDKLRVGEALRLFAGFYKRTRNTDDLLRRFGLEEKRNAFYNQLSGGQKQRLALAMALVNDPRGLFLDRPTAGLVPQRRPERF